MVFVHGYTGYADDFANQVAFMKMQGYGDAELYGTTYGEKVDGPAPGQARPSDRQVRMNQTGMACEYVRAVRLLVQAVHRFTNRTVNLVGVSMGGAVTRKAVLGGRCVESGAELGPPLTALINNYLGVIGVQKGAAFCQHSTERACNSVTGMRCGSRFLRDINSRWAPSHLPHEHRQVRLRGPTPVRAGEHRRRAGRLRGRVRRGPAQRVRGRHPDHPVPRLRPHAHLPEQLPGAVHAHQRAVLST